MTRRLLCLLFGLLQAHGQTYNDRFLWLRQAQDLALHPDFLTNQRIQSDLVQMGYQTVIETMKTRKSELLSTVMASTYVSPLCLNHTMVLGSALGSKQEWALRMLDSTGKPQAGLLDGALNWLGAFDECINITAVVYRGPDNTDPEYPYKGQYCRLGISVFKVPQQEQQQEQQAFPAGSIVLGLCVPNSCSEQDVVGLGNAVLTFIPRNISGNITIDKAVCHKESIEYDSRAIVATVVLSIIIVWTILGTLYDVFVINQLHVDSSQPSKEILENETPEHLLDNEHTLLIKKKTYEINMVNPSEPGVLGQMLVAFSVYTNGSKLLSTKQAAGSLSAVNGIRFLSMSWVVLGHSLVFQAMMSDNAMPFLLSMIKRWTYQAILNSDLAVDTFFVLSGLLLCFLSMKELDKVGGIRHFSWGMFYFHRFWRLTPPYMLVLMVWTTLFQYWGNGPFWPQEDVDKNCETYWWRNLLYINNLFPAKDMCFGWSWYLANDMQFFMLSPLMLIPLYYSGFLGMIVCTMFLLATWITAGVISSKNNLPPTVIGISQDVANNMACENLYYNKPYCRMGPYVIGMITGYFLYRTQCKVRMNRFVNLLGWVVAGACCMSVLYGLYNVQNGLPDSREVSALFNAVHRSVWAFGVCWVIFACATGHGGIVNWLLSWKVFIPLGRLTYLAYLIHIIVIDLFVMNRRNYVYLTDLEIVYSFLAFLLASNAGAFVCSLLLESPFMGLEKVFFKRERRS